MGAAEGERSATGLAGASVWALGAAEEEPSVTGPAGVSVWVIGAAEGESSATGLAGVGVSEAGAAESFPTGASVGSMLTYPPLDLDCLLASVSQHYYRELRMGLETWTAW